MQEAELNVVAKKKYLKDDLLIIWLTIYVEKAEVSETSGYRMSDVRLGGLLILDTV